MDKLNFNDETMSWVDSMGHVVFQVENADGSKTVIKLTDALMKLQLQVNRLESKNRHLESRLRK